MSFPNVIFGSDGDQFVVDSDPAADQGSPAVGQQLILDDGRKFRFSSAGAVALLTSNLMQAPIPVPNHVLQTAAAAAVGANTVALTLGATAATANQYKNGLLVVDLVANTGFGYTYGIKDHAAVASSGVFTVPLKATVQVAISTAANSVSLIQHRNNNVIITIATTPTAELAGITVKPIPIGDFGWIQTRGPCTCLTTGTIVIGQHVFASTTAGAVIAGAAFSVQPTIGIVVRVATSTDHSTINITGIDG
mgnify:CR=1 FL=1